MLYNSAVILWARALQTGGEQLVTYRCEHCGFLFIRFGPVGGCPSCEQPGIRAATPGEAARFHQQLEGKPIPEGERIEPN